MEQQVHKAQQERMVLMEQTEQRALLACKELRETMVLTVLMEQTVLLAQLACKEYRALQETTVLMVLMVQQD